MLVPAHKVDLTKLPRGKASYYGSRRLHVCNERSDYDIYLHASEVNLFALKSAGLLTPAVGYLSSIPKYGTAQLVWKLPICNGDRAVRGSADLLIFSDRRDIEIMDSVLNLLNNAASHHTAIFTNKQIRIALFNYALQQFGFTVNPNHTIAYMREAELLWPIVQDPNPTVVPF